MKAELARVAGHNLGYLLGVGERRHHIVDGVVAVTQCGVHIFKQIAVLGGVLRLDFPLAGIGGDVAQRDDVEQSIAVVDRRLLDPTTQAVPVLGYRSRAQHLGREVVEAAHIAGERLGATLGEARIVVVGTIGRRIAGDGYALDARVGVVLDKVDGVAYTGQLLRIAAVGGVDVGAVDAEVDVGRPLGRALLARLDTGSHIGPLRSKRALAEVELSQIGSRRRAERQSAATLVLGHRQHGVGHPPAVGNDSLIIYCVSGTGERSTLVDVVVTLMLNVAVASRSNYLWQFHDAVASRDYGDKRDFAVAL